MTRIAVILSLVSLAACGVDGEPVQPSGGVDVTLSSGGVGLGANVGLSRGPLTLGLGF